MRGMREGGGISSLVSRVAGRDQVGPSGLFLGSTDYAKLKPYPYFTETDFDVDAEGFDEGDMEAAITASLAESSSPARQPSNRKAGKSKSHEAGVSTPASWC